METLSRNIVPSLILAALRGFCLSISEKHAVRISAKKPARILYPALCCFGVSKIYELSELTMGLNEEELKRYNRQMMMEGWGNDDGRQGQIMQGELF